ncbi:MAG: hypothetical protein EA422_01220 [Gemmatimonadales bacterium]|nr:MAG: hypothetical protein EA422_01220 [Gemmatimonadales bacterium]
MIRTAVLRVVALVVVLSLLGCGSLLGRGDWDPFRSADERQLLVVVNNQHDRDVNVTITGPGQRSRLGFVPSRSFETYRVTWSRYQEARFVIEPTGGRRHTTGGLSVGPGDRIELVVVNPVQRSFVRR